MVDRVSLRGTLIRVVPVAFVLGAAMELFMIYVRVGDETFYETAKRLEVRRREEKFSAAQDLEHIVKRRKEKEKTEGNVDEK